MSDTATNPLKKLVERRHPQHAANASMWDFLRRAVEGGAAYVDGNLYSHPLEEPRVYAERSKRAADNHFNVTDLTLETYMGYLFQNPLTEAAKLPQALVEFFACADQDGNDIQHMAQQVGAGMAKFGILWVAVDKPPMGQNLPPELQQQLAAGTPLTAQQEKEAALAPYAYMVDPDKVLDGRFVRGVVQWLLVEEEERDDADPWASSGEVVKRWRLWERHQSTLIREVKNAEGPNTLVADTQPHGLGEVPFVPFRFRKGGGFACKGLLHEIARLDRAAFNKTSLLDEIHYQVTFPQLAIPHRGDLFDERGALTGAGRMIMTMGLHHVVPFHTESGPPVYVTPPSGPADILDRDISKLIRLALAQALLEGEIAQEREGGKGQTGEKTGVAKAYTFQKLNKRLAWIADQLEQGFQKVFRLVMKWQGEDPEACPDCCLDFPDSFEVESLAEEIAETLALQAVDVGSPAFNAALRKSLVRKAMPKATPEELALFDREIDAAAVAMGNGDMEGDLVEDPEDEDEQEPGEPSQERQEGPGTPGHDSPEGGKKRRRRGPRKARGQKPMEKGQKPAEN